MKRILAWIIAVVMMVSVLPLSVFAEGEISIADTYVYDCMRGEDGKFHRLMADVTESTGPSTYTLELNATNEINNGAVVLSDQQAMEPWEAGERYPVTYGEDQFFYVEVLETPVASLEFEDVSAFYDEEQELYTYIPCGAVYFKDESNEYQQNFQSLWLNPSNFDPASPSNFAYEFPIEYIDSQEQEPWEAGNAYEVAVKVCGVETTFEAVAKNPKPIRSISVEKMDFKEGVGSWMEESEENGGVFWMQYDVTPDRVTLTYTDESTFTGTAEEIYNETGLWLETASDQAYNHIWGLGLHTATVI